MSVLIIGAGVAGLSAGYRLVELGCPDVTVLEASEEVGGLSRCVKKNDIIFDLGPHQIHTENQRVIEYLNKILKQDLLISTKKASQWFYGRYLNYPMGLNDLIFGLPFVLSVQCFADFCFESLKSFIIKKEPENFEDWVVSHFGKKMYDVYFGPYTQKVWGKHPARLSVTCAKERIAIQNMLDVILSAISKNITKFRNHYHLPHSPYQKKFYYPKYGIGQLSNIMRDYIEQHGGRVLVREVVERVRKEDPGYSVHTTNKSAYQADTVISTIPINNLKEILSHDPYLVKPDEDLEFRSLSFVFLSVAKDLVTDNHWIYFPDRDCMFQRVMELKNFSKHMVPKGHTSVCAEIPCDFQDSVWNMGDKDIYEAVITDMEKDKYLNRADVDGYWVERERYAYPTYALDYEKKLAPIKAYIDRFDNLYSIGRQGAFRYINIDEVMLMGLETADTICKNKTS